MSNPNELCLYSFPSRSQRSAPVTLFLAVHRCEAAKKTIQGKSMLLKAYRRFIIPLPAIYIPFCISHIIISSSRFGKQRRTHQFTNLMHLRG
ncbi:hypothetical protein CEXT_520821 [Caerostris extrusa]|uniref:Uncharacterized protein n=1 Tax=Caerostris extrusa TaxID=172846 RepID=A0AAV4NWJ7_CAEEX|nr:hypothetical protein CEXT_520821 [Caerostris extrusa]